MTSTQRPNGRLVVEYLGTTPPDQPREAAIPLDICDHRLRSATPEPARLVLGQRTEIAVPPGSYLVRCQLPSGEYLSAQAEVPADSETRVQLQPAYPSPQESLSWAFLLKQIPRGEPLPDFIDDAGAKLDFGRWEHAANQDALLAWSSAPLDADVDRTIQRSTPYALAALSLEIHEGQTWLQVRGPLHAPRFVALPPAPMGRPVRVLIVRETVPLQGKGPRRGEPAPRQQGAGEQPDPLTILVSAGNLQAELLLGYLANGSFEAARRIGDPLVGDAERLVQEKGGDPSAAAVGGYYLLRAQRLDRLHNWTRNLDNWFPWLPDGAVIHAWHLLRQKPSDVPQARDRLLEAERRGLPLYSQGLRLLFDGLDLLVRELPEDAPLRAAWERVRRYAAAANWRALTTTFYGRVPSEPSARPNAG
jgi:hypothetical protein